MCSFPAFLAFPIAVLGVLLGAATLTVTEGNNVDVLVVTNSTFQDSFNVRVQLLSGSADGEGKGEGRVDERDAFESCLFGLH